MSETRTKEGVQADMLASEEDIKWLCSQDRIAALNHPNCPPEMWWFLASLYPLPAKDSPLWDLLTLAEMGRWEKMSDHSLGSWIPAHVSLMPWDQRELFAADCAERVVSIYERAYPYDRRIKEAIRARRFYARGLISVDQWERARESASGAFPPGDPLRKDCAVVFAARSASAWSIVESAYVASRAVGHLVAYSFVDNTFSQESYFDSYLKERRWQWGRIQQYLRGEVV